MAWITLAVCLALFLSLGLVVQATDIGFGVWFTEIFVILGTAWSMLRFSGRSPPQFTRLSAVVPGPMLFGFLVGIANYVAVVIPLQFLTTSLAPKSWVIDESKIFAQQTPLELAAVIAGVGVAAPLCEEFLFRGTFQRSLTVSTGKPARAILLAAAVFSAFHFDVVGFLPRFELGILFGLLYLRFDSLWPGICAHAANNLVPTLIYFLAGGTSESEGPPQIRDILSLATMGLAVLLILFWLAGVVRAWAPRPPEAHTEDRLLAPVPLSRAVLPWATAALVTLIAFYSLRAVRWPPSPSTPRITRPEHIYKM